jgi:hypothetical protein
VKLDVQGYEDRVITGRQDAPGGDPGYHSNSLTDRRLAAIFSRAAPYGSLREGWPDEARSHPVAQRQRGDGHCSPRSRSPVADLIGVVVPPESVAA